MDENEFWELQKYLSIPIEDLPLNIVVYQVFLDGEERNGHEVERLDFDTNKTKLILKKVESIYMYLIKKWEGTLFSIKCNRENYNQ